MLDGGARRGSYLPRDPRALAGAIERALTGHARARAGRIRPAVLAEYSADRLCADLARLYRDSFTSPARKEQR